MFSLSPAPGHDKPHHPETPARIAAIQGALAAAGLDVHPAVQQLQAQPDMRSVLASLALVHPRGYLDRLQQICAGLQVWPAACAAAAAAVVAKQQQQS